MPPPAPAPSSGPRVVPGALSPLTADLVRGPRRPVVVLAASPVGVYLGTHGRVLPVLTADAVDLPSAVRLAEPRGVFSVRAGEIAIVGAGCVRLPDLVVRGVRTWRPARVLPAAWPHLSGLAAVQHRLLASAGEPPDWLVTGIREALTAGDCAPAVARLVGRGPGLTPSGDDALAGCLLVRRALGLAPRCGTDPLTAAVRDRLPATTAVSAALLDGAADGWAARDVVALADAVAHADLAGVQAALPAVLAVGHSSGRDLVAGLATALDVLAPSGRIAG